MIPFRDNIPSRSFPIMTISIILVNALVFFYELSLGREVEPFIEQYGLTPAAVFAWPGSDIPLVAVALPFLTSMFLHGGWLHLIGNMCTSGFSEITSKIGSVTAHSSYFICSVVSAQASSTPS